MRQKLSRKTVTVDALGHSYEAVVTAPTCEDGGYTTHTCGACGDSYTDTAVDALGHNYVRVETQKPTCTVDGIATYTCKNGCGESFEEVIPAGHTITQHHIFNPATCTVDGTGADYCGVCQTIIPVTLPALGHDYVVTDEQKAPTCTEPGIVYAKECSRCGDLLESTGDDAITPALGHKAKDAERENEKAATCTEEGSYDSVVYCERCDTELSRETVSISALGHTAKTAVEENRAEASCTAPGSYDSVVYCSICDEELSRTKKTIAQLSHTEKEPVKENVVEATCTAAGFL